MSKFPPKCDPLQVVHDLDAHLANWDAEGALSYRLWYVPPTTPGWAQQSVVAPRLKQLVDALTLGGVKYLTIEKKVHSHTYTQRETKYLTRKGF